MKFEVIEQRTEVIIYDTDNIIESMKNEGDSYLVSKFNKDTKKWDDFIPSTKEEWLDYFQGLDSEDEYPNSRIDHKIYCSSKIRYIPDI